MYSLRLPVVLSSGVCALLFSLPLPATSRAADDPAPPAGWEEVARTDTVIVYGHLRPGSSIRELRAVGTIDAPPWVVKNVIDDGDHYAEFMPNVLEAHVLARDPVHHTSVAYAKLSAPLISPRDYVLLVHDESHAAPDGSIVYKSRWEPSTNGPAEKPGVVRIKVNEGSWLLEPIDNGRKTRTTYQLYSDGGGLPAFILNQVTKRRISDEYAAVEKRSALPQYHKTKPAYPPEGGG